MKKFTQLLLGLLALFLISALTPLAAQSDSAPKIVVVQRIKQDDGTVKIQKKRMNSQEEAKEYLRSLSNIEGQDVDLEVTWNDQGSDTPQAVESDKETIVFFRRARTAAEDTSGGKIALERLHIALDENSSERLRIEQVRTFPQRPTLGVYLVDEAPGLRLSGIVPGSGAHIAGLQAGDVLTGINGQDLTDAASMRQMLARLKAGEIVDVAYSRNGETKLAEVKLGQRVNSWEERDPCAVFIGVTLTSFGSDNLGSGVLVHRVIEGTPAAEADLQTGDLITAIDNVPVNSYAEVLRERNKHEPGDHFTLSVEREGQIKEIKARFKSCNEEPEPQPEESAPEALETPVQPDVPAPTFVERNLELLNYRAFPNPTVGRFNVQFQGEARPTTVQVVGVDGQVVFQQTLNNFDGYYNQDIDLRRTAPGTYYLQIRQGEKRLVQQVVVVPKA